jgi:enoyl-CoA hydratase/carnithine racemase
LVFYAFLHNTNGEKMLQMYDRLARLLNEAAVDDRVVITALTGAGDCYSSGNDMADALQHFAGGNGLDSIKESCNRIRYGL